MLHGIGHTHAHMDSATGLTELKRTNDMKLGEGMVGEI